MPKEFIIEGRKLQKRQRVFGFGACDVFSRASFSRQASPRSSKSSLNQNEKYLLEKLCTLHQQSPPGTSILSNSTISYPYAHFATLSHLPEAVCILDKSIISINYINSTTAPDPKLKHRSDREIQSRLNFLRNRKRKIVLELPI